MTQGTRQPPSQVRILFATERGRAAIRPRQDLRAIVGSEDDYGVVGDAELFEFVEQLPDVAVELNHTIRVNA